MELIVAGASLAIIASVVLFILIKQQKNSSIPFQQIFNKLVTENGLSIHYKDVLNNKLIGLDRTNNKLLLLDLNKNHKLECCIALSEIISCRLIQLKDEISKHVKKVFLELGQKENNKQIAFCFYDESCDDRNEKVCLTMKGEYWEQRINFHLNYWWINTGNYVS